MSSTAGATSPGPDRWLQRLAVLAGLLALAAVIWRVIAPGDGGDAATGQGSGQRAMTVEAIAIERRTLSEYVRGVGTLDASAVVDVTTEVAGRIEQLHFREGAPVAEDDLLVTIRDNKLRARQASAQAAVLAARSRLQRAEADHARARQLREQRQISEGDYDEALSNMQTTEADLEALVADLALIGEELKDTRIRAPFAGLISSRAADVGAYVEVGERLATLYQSDPMEINFTVPERHLGRLELDQEIDLLVAAWPDERFEGRIDYISPAVDPATRTVSLRAIIDNPDGRLRPGAFANVRLVLDRRDYAVAPAEALIGTRDGYIVYRIDDDDIAHEVGVETSLRENGWVAISDGLAEGDRVVRRGHARLDDGDRVRVVDAEPPEDTAATARR